jgi:hypothetical protein
MSDPRVPTASEIAKQAIANLPEMWRNATTLHILIESISAALEPLLLSIIFLHRRVDALQRLDGLDSGGLLSEEQARKFLERVDSIDPGDFRWRCKRCGVSWPFDAPELSCTCAPNEVREVESEAESA